MELWFSWEICVNSCCSEARYQGNSFFWAGGWFYFLSDNNSEVKEEESIEHFFKPQKLCLTWDEHLYFSSLFNWSCMTSSWLWRFPGYLVQFTVCFERQKMWENLIHTCIYKVYAYRLYMYFSLLCAQNNMLIGSLRKSSWLIYLRSCVERDVHPCGSAASAGPGGTCCTCLCSCPSHTTRVRCRRETTRPSWAVQSGLGTQRGLRPRTPAGCDPWLVFCSIAAWPGFTVTEKTVAELWEYVNWNRAR